MTPKQRARQLAEQSVNLVLKIDEKMRQVKKASMFNLKPLLEEMGALQSEQNRVQATLNELMVRGMRDE